MSIKKKSKDFIIFTYLFLLLFMKTLEKKGTGLAKSNFRYLEGFGSHSTCSKKKSFEQQTL